MGSFKVKVNEICVDGDSWYDGMMINEFEVEDHDFVGYEDSWLVSKSDEMYLECANVVMYFIKKVDCVKECDCIIGYDIIQYEGEAHYRKSEMSVSLDYGYKFCPDCGEEIKR